MTPQLFEIVTHTGKGIDGLPAPEVPYYVFAKEGLFLHRATQIGTVLVKQAKMPATIGELGFTNGVFNWVGPKIPAAVISQAYDFFRRVFEQHRTEAEVLITMHNETGAFRLFVPFQRTSYGGVKSVYEPTHINRSYTVVGTLHSHCDFSAFHSGTDSADASDMDGVHFTIGQIGKAADPQIVAMVAMNGREFHYANPGDIAELDFHADTAPAWWDAYVFPSSTQADKPKALKSITQAQWNEFRGIVAAKTRPAATAPSRWQPPSRESSHWGDSWYDDDDYIMRDWTPTPRSIVPFQPTKASAKFNRSRQKGRGKPAPRPQWAADGSLTTDTALDTALDWAQGNGCLSGDDWEHIRAADVEDTAFWQKFFTDRMADLSDVLECLGLKVAYSVTHAQAPDAPVPGQMTAFSSTKEVQP